jgi:hypothetical protein
MWPHTCTITWQRQYPLRALEARDLVHVQCASQLGVLRACIDELSGQCEKCSLNTRERAHRVLTDCHIKNLSTLDTMSLTIVRRLQCSVEPTEDKHPRQSPFAAVQRWCAKCCVDMQHACNPTCPRVHLQHRPNLLDNPGKRHVDRKEKVFNTVRSRPKLLVWGGEH